MKCIVYGIIFCILSLTGYSSKDSLVSNVRFSLNKQKNTLFAKQKFDLRAFEVVGINSLSQKIYSIRALRMVGEKTLPAEKSFMIFNDNNNISQGFDVDFRKHVFAPVEMDIVETIIICTGVICLVPLILDLVKEREPSVVSVAGGAVFGTCFIAALTYRYTIKDRKKDKD